MRLSGTKRTLIKSPAAYDPYQSVTPLIFHFNNSLTTYKTFAGAVHTCSGYTGYLPFGEGNSFNLVGVPTYQSKGTYNSFSTNSKFGGYSFNCNGVNRLNFADYDVFAMYRDFTTEMWICPTDLTSDQYPLGRGDLGSSTVGSYIKVKASGNGVEFWYQNISLISTSTTGLFTANKWTHIAVSRSGNNWYFFVDGVLEGTASNSTTTTMPCQTVLGGDNTSNTYFSGQICEFRYTQACRYTNGFPVPTAPWPNYQTLVPGQFYESDPYYSQVALLCHFEGANGSTTFTDNSPNPKTLTNSGCTIQNVSILASVAGTTNPAILGSGCVVFAAGYPGTARNLQLPSSSDFNFGTGDFTIEFWAIRNGNTKSAYIFSCGATSLELRVISQAGNNGKLALMYNGSNLITNAGWGLYTGYWQNIVVQRISGVAYLYVNGFQVGSSAFTNSLDISGMVLGRRTTSDNTTFWCGNMDELRITNGVGRYNSTFVPLMAEFPNQ